MKLITIILICLFTIILAKVLWVIVMTIHIKNPDTEKKDILRRLNYLINESLVSPQEMIDKMPSFIGQQFRGEWAMYYVTMLSIALTNCAIRYPETRDMALRIIRRLIDMAQSEEFQQYDAVAWNESPTGICSDKSHLSYHSLVALMISAYKTLKSDKEYELDFAALCNQLVLKTRNSYDFNLETYPGSGIYVPDMLAAIAAIANRSMLNNGQYQKFIDKWLGNMKKNHIDSNTGLLVSTINSYNKKVLGSYSALSIFYLTFVNKEFAREQYNLFKKHFFKKGLIPGIKENIDGSNQSVYEIDSGPVMFGLSPTGTAFAIGAATYFKDWKMRRKLLMTGELAGFTVSSHKFRHYLLSNYALVGEAIVLAMRTAVDWKEYSQSLSC